MRKTDLINKISSKNTVASIKAMQVLDEESEVFFNFINSLHSDYTKASYKFCLDKFLNHYRIDLLSFLKLPEHDITNLIIKYLVDKKVSRQYKNLITATLKHACEINDIVLNWNKIKKFINTEKTSMKSNEKFGIIIALSIAMLGATTVVTYGALQVEAAAPTWCYAVTGGNKCIADPDAKRSDCVAASQADTNAVNPGKCFNEKKIS